MIKPVVSVTVTSATAAAVVDVFVYTTRHERLVDVDTTFAVAALAETVGNTAYPPSGYATVAVICPSFAVEAPESVLAVNVSDD